jgi:hypothetical protein
VKTSILVVAIILFSCMASTASAQRPGLAIHPLALTADLLVSEPTPNEASPDGPELTLPTLVESDGCECVTVEPSCCWLPRFYGQAEALFLYRDNGSLVRPIIVDTSAPLPVGAVPLGADNTLLRTVDLRFAVEPGLRVLLGYRINERHALEFSYFSIFDWARTIEVIGDDNLAIPGDLGLASNDFYNASIMRVDYSATLNSFELNGLLTDCYCEEAADSCSPRLMRVLSLFAGFRYLNLDEEFNIRPTDFDEGTSDYNVRTENDLYGAQIGARIRRQRDRFGWDLTCKAGVFGNSAEQSQFVTDFPPPFELRTHRSRRGGNVAFVGELGWSLSYQLTPHWGVRGGYNLMWIEGVALAPDQLDFTRTPTSGTQLHSQGGLFLHGASVGVEGFF